jgi:hypothetical protein
VKKLSGLIDFSGKYRQFSVPTQHENLDVSAHGAQRLRLNGAQPVDLPPSSN